MAFTLRPATQEDYPRIVELINSQSPEPTTVAEVERNDRLRESDDPFLRLMVVDESGRAAGYGVCSSHKHAKPGHFHLNVRVDGPSRRQGAGRALYQALESFAREKGASRIDAAVREADPAGWAFAELLGYVKEHHLFESTLELAAFDPTPFADSFRAACEAGFRFTSLAEFGDSEAVRRRYFEFTWALSRDIPGTEGQPKPPFELFMKHVADSPRWDARNIILAVDGDQWAAIAELSKLDSGGMYNGFTGVHRDFRGRGLALALKLAAIERAKELGVPYLRTNNHSVNQRMLAVNRKLGYVPEPGLFAIYKPL